MVVLLLSLSVHEAAHAWAAYQLGDPTAQQLGRLSLNPLVHIDMVGTVLLPAIALATVALASLLVPWLISQANPAWSLRYTAVAVGPLLLLAALGTARAGRLGIAAVAITALVWLAFNPPSTKSNVHSVAEAIAPSLQPGDTVISTQPEQVPVLHYYLHDIDLRYATLFGPLTVGSMPGSGVRRCRRRADG